jgi:hypothetical protein
MIPISQLSTSNYDVRNKIDYDCLDEFIRQILTKLLNTPESSIGGTTTKPIFRGFKLIHSFDNDKFNDDLNAINTELYISIERDFNGSNRREGACHNNSSPTYNIYCRMLIDSQRNDTDTQPNFTVRQRMTQVVDTLMFLLTSKQENQDGYITSVINTDIANIDPKVGKKFITNLVMNKIETNSRFELDETLNSKNYYTGGFSYVFNVMQSDRNIWTDITEAESYEIY